MTVVNLKPEIGVLRLSDTMLNKYIIDANKSIRRCALMAGIDFDTMPNGHKDTLPCTLFYGSGAVADRLDTYINFYKTARGDRRVWINGFTPVTKGGDELHMTYERTGNGVFLVVNVTQVTKEALYHAETERREQAQ